MFSMKYSEFLSNTACPSLVPSFSEKNYSKALTVFETLKLLTVHSILPPILFLYLNRVIRWNTFTFKFSSIFS